MILALCCPAAAVAAFVVAFVVLAAAVAVGAVGSASKLKRMAY